MSNCRVYDDNIDCRPIPPEPPEPKVCAPFSVCLPFGRRLVYDGECLSLEGTPTIADGTYGVLVVEDGCIVDAKANPVFEYTPPPCAPAAAPCDGEGGADVILAPGACNLLARDGFGRLGAFLDVQAGPGIDIAGCGTSTSPLVITATVDSTSLYLTSGTPDILPITGDGSQSAPWVVSHGLGALGPGAVGGLTIDAYGHVIGYADPEGGAIFSIIGGPGVEVSQAAGVATISAAMSPIGAGDWKLGGFRVSTNLAGNVVDVDREINIAPGVIDPIQNQLRVDEYGSITELLPVSRVADTYWTRSFSGHRDDTAMTITTTQRGQLRITYRGALGAYTAPPNTQGLILLQPPFGVTVQGVQVMAYGRLTGTTLTEIHAIATSQYNAGDIKIAVTVAAGGVDDPVFTDTGILDVTLTSIGVV